MASSVVHTAKAHALHLVPPSLTLANASSFASRLVFVQHSQLPEGIQFLPSLFRIMALALVMPVVLLTVVDVLGWAAFKLLLRPLGYASTVRFKDPEPPSLVVDANGNELSKSASSTPSPTSQSVLLPTTEESSSSASETSSAPSSPAYSTHLTLHDEPPRSPSSSSSSSHHHRPHRSHHEQSPSLSRKISRDRAASVGLDGPLFDGGETTDAGASTPGSASESEASDYVGAGEEARRKRALRGDGVPKGGFKLGLTVVVRREGGRAEET
ncbi:hypothetical protein JCM8097_008180 [Rhodosporidiobolus ruineniae]